MRRVLSVVIVLMMGFVLTACNNELISSSDGPFTVSFNSNGGSAVADLEVDLNEFFLPNEVPTKTGYLFAGWYLDENFYYPMAFSAGTASNLTLYAKWVLIEQKLTTSEIRELIELVLAENGYDMTATEMISAIEALFPEQTGLSTLEVRSLVELVLAENGYDMTATEMISAIEALFPIQVSLSEEEIRVIVSEMLALSPMNLSEEELTQYIIATLSAQQLDFMTEDTVTLLVNELLASNEPLSEEAIIASVLANINVVTEFENYIVDLLAEVSQSVVMIDSYYGSQIESGGSGVIYKRVGNTYYVLTNEHVVNGYTQTNFAITMFTPSGLVKINKGTNIKLLGTSVTHDLAVLTFTSTANFRVIELGNHADLRVGQMVFAIGSPLDLPNTRTMGMISAIDREMWDDYGMDTITIQHTAAINPGNSGGALINIYGQLVGLNNMSYVDMEVGEGINGLHFAIQIDIIRQMIPTLE